MATALAANPSVSHLYATQHDRALDLVTTIYDYARNPYTLDYVDDPEICAKVQTLTRIAKYPVLATKGAVIVGAPAIIYNAAKAANILPTDPDSLLEASTLIEIACVLSDKLTQARTVDSNTRERMLTVEVPRLLAVAESFATPPEATIEELVTVSDFALGAIFSLFTTSEDSDPIVSVSDFSELYPRITLAAKLANSLERKSAMVCTDLCRGRSR